MKKILAIAFVAMMSLGTMAQTFNKIRIVVRWMKLNELKLLAADELVFVTTDNASCY